MIDCKPCIIDDKDQPFKPKEIDLLCKPCELPPEPPQVLPTIKKETIVTSCLFAALYAMTHEFYCETKPNGCGK